jgi:integrase/recombinase XerD
MLNTPLLGPWLRRFLVEHLLTDRNLARQTQRSYRDTLALLIPFVCAQTHKDADQLTIEDISAERVRQFLRYLEDERQCSIATRNQRLAALHAFARFLGLSSPEHVGWSGEVRTVPFKKAPSTPLTYLEKGEMDAVLKAPDRHTAQGHRDYALLLFLYNTGARATETAQLTIADLCLAPVPATSPSSVWLCGKGNKRRRCPLWPETVTALLPLIQGRKETDPVFLNRRSQPMTRFGIHTLLERHVVRAAQACPALTTKRVRPQTIRHTTATHLLRAGVDINTIRAWLGHVSLRTTNVYAEVDLEMKAKALAHCEIAARALQDTHWRDDPGLMAFLRSL